MRTTKSTIVAVLSAVVLVMGTFFIVRAMEKEKPVVKVEKPKVVSQQVWVDTDASGENVIAIRTSPAPQPGTGSGCYQANLGDFCARLLEFETEVDPSDLVGKSMEEIETQYGPVSYANHGKLPQN